MGISDFVNHPHGNDTPLHSSGYAKVASGGTMGSASPQSFDQRIGIERNRRAVARYGHSMIGRGHMREDVRPRLGTKDSLRQPGPIDTSAARPPLNTQAPPRAFREPPSRGYNPYG